MTMSAPVTRTGSGALLPKTWGLLPLLPRRKQTAAGPLGAVGGQGGAKDLGPAFDAANAQAGSGRSTRCSRREGGGFEVMLVAVLAASKMQADSGWASRGSRRAEPV